MLSPACFKGLLSSQTKARGLAKAVAKAVAKAAAKAVAKARRSVQ